MFESNFPVDRQSLTYPVVWNAFQRIVADHYDEAERDDSSGDLPVACTAWQLTEPEPKERKDAMSLDFTMRPSG